VTANGDGQFDFVGLEKDGTSAIKVSEKPATPDSNGGKTLQGFGQEGGAFARR
jgi:hypothetical protein